MFTHTYYKQAKSYLCTLMVTKSSQTNNWLWALLVKSVFGGWAEEGRCSLWNKAGKSSSNSTCWKCICAHSPMQFYLLDVNKLLQFTEERWSNCWVCTKVWLTTFTPAQVEIGKWTVHVALSTNNSKCFKTSLIGHQSLIWKTAVKAQGQYQSKLKNETKTTWQDESRSTSKVIWSLFLE